MKQVRCYGHEVQAQGPFRKVSGGGDARSAAARESPFLKWSRAEVLVDGHPSVGSMPALTTPWGRAAPSRLAKWILEHGPGVPIVVTHWPCGHSHSSDHLQPKPDTCVLHARGLYFLWHICLHIQKKLRKAAAFS